MHICCWNKHLSTITLILAVREVGAVAADDEYKKLQKKHAPHRLLIYCSYCCEDIGGVGKEGT